MLAQRSTLSLFQLLHEQLERRLSTVRCTKTMLLHLSHTLEDLILSHHLPAFLFAGFQTPENWLQEIERYQNLAQVVQQIYVFAAGSGPEPAANLHYIPLDKHGALSQEWFIAILAEAFSAILCGREHPASETPGTMRQFDILWSFEPEIINLALDFLTEVIALYRPEKLSPLQAARANLIMTHPNATIITQFTMELFRFEEKLQHTLRATTETLQQTGVTLDQRETQRDQAEAKLRYQANEETLRKVQQAQQELINSIDGIVWEVDANTFQFLFVSSQAERLLGYPVEAWLNEPDFWINHTYEADREWALNYCIKSTQELKNHELEYRMVAADGRLVWLHDIITVVVEDNRAVKLRGVMLDITQRKQAEESLRDNEEQFRLLFELAPIGMALVAPMDGQFLRVNQAYCQMVGYTAAELLTRRFTDVTHPDDLEANLALDEQILRGEKSYFQMEKRYISKEGNIIHVLLQVTLARDSQGNPLHFISQIVDITERKRLEEQLRQSQKLEAIGRLAGGVAHDFNNLLTVINGYSDLLLHLARDNDPSRRDLEQIRKAGERAASLTRQLLAFSRQQILQPQILDLNTIVTDMDNMLRRLIGEHIELVTRPQPGLGRIKADPGQLEQVIMNLAINACDAMSQGGQLTIETANMRLDEAYTRQHVNVTPGPHVMLAVSDTGTGMDANTIAHIFEPFYTTKEIGKGTGLGLATVYGIVTQSGGHLQIHSEIGRGTTFKIYFPQIKELPKAAERDNDQTHLPHGLETILLVEDEPSVRALIHSILKNNGYAVLHAANGQEALEISRQYPAAINLLLTDVVIPKMSGRELAERLTSLRPDLKVLYMSGYTNDAMIHHSALDLRTAFLYKPFTPDDLAHKVRQVLDMDVK